MTKSIYLVYADKDAGLAEKLKQHLSILKKNGRISTWDASEVKPGQEAGEMMDLQLNKAGIVLLLISSDFLASNDCYDKAMEKALQRHEKGEAVVVPILLRHCDVTGAPFEKLATLPANGKPIISKAWHDADDAFAQVANGIRKLIDQMEGLAKEDEKGELAVQEILGPPLKESASKSGKSTKDWLTKGIGMVTAIFGAFSGYVLNIAPPVQGVEFSTGIASFVMLIIFLFVSVFSDNTWLDKRRRLWTRIAGVTALAFVVLTFLYWSNYRDLTFQFPPFEDPKVTLIAGKEYTPQALKAIESGSVSSDRKADILADFGGVNELDNVWTRDSIKRAEGLLMLLYTAMMAFLALTIFSLLELLLNKKP